MEIGVPSRFACLNIEDEDLSSVQNSKPKEPNKKVKKPGPEVSKTAIKKLEKTASAKRVELKPDAAKQPPPVVNKKSKKKPSQQWDEWKQKDEEMDNGVYEEDLRNAILLSKLDYEHNKVASTKQSAEENAKQDKKKAKKNKTISLDKFLNHVGDKQPVTRNNSATLEKLPSDGRLPLKVLSTTTNCMNAKQGDFFNSVDSDTKAELKKEQINAKRKKREANINEVISLSQYQEKYEAEHRLRVAAEQELKVVKSELAAASLKIQGLCQIISEGQMKDKATILIENQQLTVVKNELTDSVANLHALLEKERSKVASLTSSLNNKSKPKEKKRK